MKKTKEEKYIKLEIVKFLLLILVLIEKGKLKLNQLIDKVQKNPFYSSIFIESSNQRSSFCSKLLIISCNSSDFLAMSSGAISTFKN